MESETVISYAYRWSRSRSAVNEVELATLVEWVRCRRWAWDGEDEDFAESIACSLRISLDQADELIHEAQRLEFEA